MSTKRISLRVTELRIDGFLVIGSGFIEPLELPLGAVASNDTFFLDKESQESSSSLVPTGSLSWKPLSSVVTAARSLRLRLMAARSSERLGCFS